MTGHAAPVPPSSAINSALMGYTKIAHEVGLNGLDKNAYLAWLSMSVTLTLTAEPTLESRPLFRFRRSAADGLITQTDLGAVRPSERRGKSLPLPPRIQKRESRNEQVQD